MISVAVQGLRATFGTAVALDSVDLDIEPGELFFLLGPSGCGKTTLLRCLAGFYQPRFGKIYFGGKEVTRQPPHRRNAGMVFQNYALWPHLTVARNVAFGLEQRKASVKEIEERVREALELVRMGDYAGRKPNTLSGGQQQRVALARALAPRPRCLLLDEPLSNLDAKLRLEMRAEIRRICKESGLTTVYVTHDQKEALSVADRGAVMSEGRILQTGTAQEIYRRPKNCFVADFVGETNFLEGEVLRCGGGLISAQTALGKVIGVSSGEGKKWKEGARVTLALRPECLRLEKIESEVNCFQGTVEETVYYGELARYRFRSGETALKVFELNPRHLGGTGAGRLFAAADPEDVVVLEE